jgi:hypothetical protein
LHTGELTEESSLLVTVLKFEFEFLFVLAFEFHVLGSSPPEIVLSLEPV